MNDCGQENIEKEKIITEEESDEEKESDEKNAGTF